jgi:hypothetical protein
MSAAVGLAAAAVLTLAGPASAASVLASDRGLPTDNLNNAAGADRSNVAWSFGADYVTGDTFSVGAPGESWVVTGVRTWNIGPEGVAFEDEFSDVTLYLGDGGIAPVPADVGHTAVTYADGTGYQGTFGAFRQLWQNDFTGLAYEVEGGQTYYAAADGASATSNWFNHASNAALSGSPQDGADDHYNAWDKSDLATAPYACDSGGSGGDCDGGWDKSSDINVQVFASQVATDKGACKQGGWQDLARSDGSSFTNQGDCIQYVNTGK